ncbi:hypothetical protein PTNB85_03390 [Pyrenophora teres f. teres]|uniref:4'-phosphopantetheinyl transferase family protein n=1 Tax=Pyrenophora teres f. teres TaxID=97479 RepID=A0A6S6W347_9PLEO|nr:hypothetical protein HRS9122_09538 [Pyrenophora teres f. teres]KAE8839160.1 hypothetical protein HRS9139_03543 [Pyrenophora teres f. teres]KAE8845125.1 hypothetical protein PTNB85_03390 [Pyrenophora teres f. teres]CAE7175428.1 4'-phosphopantetheinyl transferase family protein [Pyrenophora teres f. teres]
MPLRPFPIPFKVGTDICYVPRIRKFITQPSHGEPQRPVRRLLRKLLTEHERQYFWQRFGRRAPFDSIERVSQFLAGSSPDLKGSPQRKPVAKHALI